MRFGAFIMTYNRPSILRATLQSILEQTRPPEHILVVDNGDAALTVPILQEFDPDKVAYHSMGENTGPAGATAYALHRLVGEKYDWIYWVDDDDPPQTPDMLERLLTIVDARPDDGHLGGVGAVGSRFNWKTGEMQRLTDNELAGLLHVDIIAGNQQLILSRSMIEQVGVADRRLFFGLYEPEYCLRIRKAGYDLLVDGAIMREQREQSNRLNLEIKHAAVAQYPLHMIWQRYYRTRNYIFMMRRTFGRPDLARRETAKAMARSLTAWTRGWAYGRCFFPLQIRGIRDGYRGRMGRTVLPRPKHPAPG